MIEPTIGRKLWLHRKNSLDPNQPEDVSICSVISSTRVNVAGFDAVGNHIKLHNVLLLQDNASPPEDGEPYVEWMPYQVKQAAKENPVSTQS